MKLHYVSRKRIIYCSIVFTPLFILLRTRMNTLEDYECISKENILQNLYEETNQNLSSTAAIDCYYEDILYDETALFMNGAGTEFELLDGHKIQDGGEYAPSECRPKFSIAVIVPYRDRAIELRNFLIYMHTFFYHQLIHYRIFVVEQMNSKPFNRGKLINIGALAAMKAGYPCLILHDVDLLPIRTANLYACTIQPRHMSATINKYGFVVPYVRVFGGAISIISKQFKDINGMSNNFFGTSGANEDFYSRLEENEISVCRFDLTTSQYWEQQKPEQQQLPPNVANHRTYIDGLNTLKYTEVETVSHPLFTHIMVDV